MYTYIYMYMYMYMYMHMCVYIYIYMYIWPKKIPYCSDGVFFCIFALSSAWTKKHKNTLGFQVSIVLAISFSATLKFSLLRFQYSAKDRPYVFSSQREFPLMFSIFGAFAPLRFQSINKNVSYKNRCCDSTALSFSAFCERPPIRFQ